MEETVSRLSLLIETPTNIRRSAPEVVWEMVRLEPPVLPEEMASTAGLLPGGEVEPPVGVEVGGSGVSVGVGVRVPVSVGVGVGEGPAVSVGVGVGEGPGVSVGGAEDTQAALPESVNVCPAIGMNSQS